MGQLISSTCQTCLSRYKPQSNNPEPDERTPLIADPPQPRPPPHSIVDSAQQRADEAAANKIVDDTVRCLVHVYSQAPFSHLRIDNTVPESPHTPEGSTSTWRVYDPPTSPPVSPEIRRLRLGYDQPCSSDNSNHQKKGGTVAPRRSYHSLKTIVNQSLQSTPPPSSFSQNNVSHKPDHQSDISISDCTPSASSLQHHLPREGTSTSASDTQYDTITSFQTALDDTTSLDQIQVINQDPHSDTPHPPPDFVGKLWPDFPNSTSTTTLLTSGPSTTDSDGFLTDDPQALRALLESGFRLKDSGPILVEL